MYKNTYSNGKKMMSYTCFDGSGNSYSIKPQLVVYQPIKPEESSSGQYDGGPAWQKAITQEQWDEVREKIETACADEASQQTNRTKGTFVIVKEDEAGKQTSTHIFKMTSQAQKPVLEWLNKLK